MDKKPRHAAKKEMLNILLETFGARDIPPNRTNADLAVATMALLGEVISDIAQEEASNDARHRATIYRHVAEIISQELSLTEFEAVLLVLMLINDTDQAILHHLVGDVEVTQFPPDLVQKVRDTLLTITVIYTIGDLRNTVVTTEVYFMRRGTPIRTTFEMPVAWHDLPSDVREKNLRSGEKVLTYKLYPTGG
jgi:hypothetical protein